MRRKKEDVPFAIKIAMAPLGLLLKLLSFIPLPILYLFSDLLAFIARDIIRYRKPLVERNLRDCFPEAGEAQIRAWARQFYRHLTDYFIETVKFPGMSDRTLMKRMEFRNVEDVDRLLSSGRDIVVYTSHFANWEWTTSLSLWSGMKDKAIFAHVYKPLSNKWFDRWFKRVRSRLNRSVPMDIVFRQLLQWHREEKPWITGFLSDQRPTGGMRRMSVDFFGISTPFISGTEDITRKLNSAVYYFDTRVSGRGRYVCTLRKITDSPREMPEGEITRRYAALLEEQIRSYPPAYLWSHNRWLK